MNIEALRDYCLSLPAAGEKMPFGDDTLLFVVGNKMFCATGIERYDYINVKCDPEKAIELRERYDAVMPGYHMNKRHWNSILTGSGISDSLIKEWIRDSYDLVVKSLPSKVRNELIRR